MTPRRPSPDDPHVVELGASHFTVQHPLWCRPDMMACGVHGRIRALDGVWRSA